jgi:hypothetical protein
MRRPAGESRAFGLPRGAIGPEPVRAGNGFDPLFSAAEQSSALQREAK